MTKEEIDKIHNDLKVDGFTVTYKVKEDVDNIKVAPTTVAYKEEKDAEEFLESVIADGGKGVIFKTKTFIYERGGKINHYEIAQDLKAEGIPADTGQRLEAVEYVEENYGIQPSEIVRAAGDDAVYNAIRAVEDSYELDLSEVPMDVGEREEAMLVLIENQGFGYDELFRAMSDDDVYSSIDYLLTMYGIYNEEFEEGGSVYSDDGDLERYFMEGTYSDGVGYFEEFDSEEEMRERYKEWVDEDILGELDITSVKMYGVKDSGDTVDIPKTKSHKYKGSSIYEKGAKIKLNLNSRYEHDSQLYKPNKSYVISQEGVVLSTHETPFEAIEARDGGTNQKVHFENPLHPLDRNNIKSDSKYRNGGSIKSTSKGAKLASLFDKSNELQIEEFGVGYSKGDLMNLAYGKNYSNVDSALPMGALEAKGIESMQRYRYVMDYNDNSMGEIVDLYEKISERNPTVEVFNEDFELQGEYPINEVYEKFFKNNNSNYFIQAVRSDKFKKGGSAYTGEGEIKELIKNGSLVFSKTKKEHSDIYGLDSDNPLFIQHLCIDTKSREKGFGSEVLEHIENYARNNNHDMIFGHISSKSAYGKEDVCDPEKVKGWMKNRGYKIAPNTNDFYKEINGSKTKFKKGGRILSKHWFDGELSFLNWY